jgi:hypothetical protein
MAKARIILDKSYLQGTSAEEVEQLCKSYRTFVPDVLLIELFSAPSPIRAKCLRKIRHDQDIIAVITGVGDLFRFELVNRSPCTPLEGRFIVNAKLSDSLFNSVCPLTPEQTQYLSAKETELRARTLDMISIWRSVDRFFPRLRGLKPGGDREAIEEARRVVGNDTTAIRQIYHGICQEWVPPNGFPGKLPPADLIGPNWAVYRWLQVNLLAAIDVVSKYTVAVVPKAEKRTNERHDLDYAVTAALIDGLATKDQAMADRFRLLCPAGLLA